MSQIVLDLRDVKRNTQILQQLLRADLTCSSDDRCLITSAGTTAINQTKINNDSKLRTCQGSHPNDSFYVNLDPKAEDIIQNLSDDMFVLCFHFDKVMARCLLMELHQRTYYNPLRDVGEKLSFDLSVLATLSYLHHGHLECLAQLECFKWSSDVFKKCIQRMCQTIVYFLGSIYLRFPCSEEEQRYVKSGFLRKYGVPGVVGVLECYYVRVESVPDHEKHMYVSRRCMQPSIAVQVICDQNYRFLDVNPRFSGNTYNTHIWERSHIKDILQCSQEIDPKTWLIADRGYRLTSSIINPYRNAVDIRQESVNTALMEIHHVVDKSFGLLTARFRCLKSTLPFSHKHAANVVTACATLHNYLLAKNRPIEKDLNVSRGRENILPNAHCEDVFSPIGLYNRNFVKDFIFNNSSQILYRMRKNSNMSFISDDHCHISVDH